MPAAPLPSSSCFHLMGPKSSGHDPLMLLPFTQRGVVVANGDLEPHFSTCG